MSEESELLEAKLREYRERGVTRVKVGLTDIDGVIRGKYVGLDKFASLLVTGGGFCDCIFGWDVNDQLYEDGTYTGWHTGFPDARFRLLVASERIEGDVREERNHLLEALQPGGERLVYGFDPRPDVD